MKDQLVICQAVWCVSSWGASSLRPAAVRGCRRPHAGAGVAAFPPPQCLKQAADRLVCVLTVSVCSTYWIPTRRSKLPLVFVDLLCVLRTHFRKCQYSCVFLFQLVIPRKAFCQCSSSLLPQYYCLTIHSSSQWLKNSHHLSSSGAYVGAI